MKKIYNLSLIIFFICQLAFSSIPSYTQEWLWAQSAGQTGDDVGYSVTTDKNGYVYITGYFNSSTITFGSITLSNVGYSDVFVAKYDNNGNVIWAKSAGGDTTDVGYSIATDKSGNVYLTGFFTSNTITFGSITLTNSNANGNPDIFLVKYDTNGNVLWARSAEGSSIIYGNSVATYDSKDVYITGKYWGNTITFGSYTLTNDDGYDVFLVKYDSLGSVKWAKSFGKYDHEAGCGVATDKNGNVFMTGFYQSNSITFGSFTLQNSSTSMSDIFLVKCDSLGNILWANNIGGTNFDEVGNNSITTDDSSNVYVTGYFMSNPMIVGTSSLTNLGNKDMFIVKYSPSGNVKWAKSAGGPDWDEGTSVTTDKRGNVFVTGYFASPTLTFGTNTLTNAGSFDIFIAQYDSLGIVKWSNRVGIVGPEIIYNATTDLNEDVCVTGNMPSGSVPFGSFTLNNPFSGSNIFIAKLSKAVYINDFNNDNSNHLLIYPNPSNGKFFINILNDNSAINTLNVEIYNILGEKVYSLQKIYPTSESEWYIDISTLDNGVYFINAFTEKENISSMIEINK